MLKFNQICFVAFEHMNELSLICSRQWFGTCPPYLGRQYCKSKLMYVEKMPCSDIAAYE